MSHTNNKEQIELTESEKRGLVNLVTDNKEVEEFYKKLGYTLIEIKSSVFREEESTFVFQTDNKNHTVNGSTILYDHAVTLHQELQKARQSERDRIRQRFKALCIINNDGDCKYFKDELHNDLRDGAKFIAQHILDEILAPTPDQSELDQPTV